MNLLRILLIIQLISLSFRSEAQNNAVSNSINTVAEAYFDIKNALVAGDGKKAAAAAKEFIEVTSKVSDKEMSAAQSTSWKNYVNKLQYDSRHISEVPEPEHQREHFAVLSKNLFEVLKAFKGNTSAIYYQYCPMKKLYWISESAAIKNPYYGSKMLDCGRTVQTLGKR